MKLNAHNIVEMRNHHGWSQEDLAEASDLSVRTIQRLETEGKGSLESAKAVAAAFDVSLEKVKEPELQWRHHRLIWKPLGTWIFWSMLITVCTALCVRFGLISDLTGQSYVLMMIGVLFCLALAQIGARFYGEFGPFWKNWDF